MTRYGRLFLMLLVVAASCALAQTQPVVPTAAPAASIAPPAPPPVKPEELPASLVIMRAATEGQVKDELARLRMVLEIESFKGGEQRVALFPADIAVTGWSVKRPWFGPKAYVRRTERGLEFVVEGKGRYKVSLDLVLKVSKDKAVHKVMLPVVRALAATTSLTVPGADLEFATEPKLGIETVAEAKASTVNVYGGEGMVALTWKPKAVEKVLKPLVFADQAMRLRIGQGVMRIDTAIDYTIVQGSVTELQIRFPADCNLLNIAGEEVRTWDVAEAAPGTPRTLKVTLTGEVQKKCRLELKLEKVLPDVKVELEAPAIEPLDVVREKGSVAVYSARGISVEAVSLENVGPVDVREVAAPPEGEDEVRLAFRYLKRPFMLKLRAGEVVAKTSVEILTLVRAGMDSLRLTSSLNYAIRDASVFQFRVKLDEGLKLVDISGPNINNWQFDEAGRVLTVALRSKAEGSYQLQLETELQKAVSEKAAIPAVHAMDVDREAGYVAVLPAPGMKVETSALTGISQIDVKELPQELLKQSPALAYRYIRPDYQVAVNVSEIEPEVLADVQSVATVDEHELSLNTEIRYSIRRAGIFQLRVAIPKELRRTSVEGEDIDDTSWDDKVGILTVNLRSKVTGSYVLKLRTEKTLEELEKGLEMPVIRAMDVKKEQGFLAIVSKTNIRMKPAEGKKVGLEDIGVSDLPPEMLKRAGEVALAFKYFSQPWSVALGVERIESRVTAEVFNLLSVGEKLMTVSATINYTILHAGVDVFAVKVPAGATAVDIDGEGIKRREEDKQSGTWKITLQSKRSGSYTLFVSFEQKLSPEQTVIPYAGVETVDVQRETGYLSVTSRPDVELAVGDQDIENLTAIDSREVPQGYMQGVTLPVLLAYRYVAHPYVLRMGASPHPAADVTVAVVESARFSTTVTEEGNMITDMVLVLRNSRQQYLDLKLPERIWHAFVAGQPVTPLLDGKITKVPVARAAGLNAPFEVRLRYSEERPKLGRLGSIRLESPLRDIDAMRLGWTLSLPEGYEIVRDTGNIRRLPSYGLMEEVLQRLNPDVEVRAAALAAPSQPDQQYNPNYMRNNEAQQRIQTEAGGKGAQVSAIYTGSKPLPRNTYVFQSLIVSGKEPALVEAQFVKGSVGIPLKGVFVAIAALVCVLFWRVFRWRPLTKVAALLGCALVLLGVRTLAEGAYRGYLTAIIITVLVVAGLMLLYTIYAWLSQCWNRWREGRRAKADQQKPAAEPPAQQGAPA